MVNIMVKGHTLGLMEENMLVNGRMGKQNGHGTVTPPYWKYVREWKGNDFHGQGTMISTDGAKWVGDFRGNKPLTIRQKRKHQYKVSKWKETIISYKNQPHHPLQVTPT